MVEGIESTYIFLNAVILWIPYGLRGTEWAVMLASKDAPGYAED